MNFSLFFKRLFAFLFLSVLAAGFFPVQAQNINDFINVGNYPVNYDQQLQIGRGTPRPKSIDECLTIKEYFFNEIHNVWVEGLVRCKVNSKNILSRAQFQGVLNISIKPEDEQACVGKREGQILVQGTPSEDRARAWTEHCSYLGTIGGAGPVGTNTPTGFLQNFNTGSTGSTSLGTRRTTTTGTTGTISTGTVGSLSLPNLTADQDAQIRAIRSNTALTEAQRNEQIQRIMNQAGSTDFTPVYDGPGVQVPSAELIPSGISRRQSLSELIVFYTNATLPYVSIISVFAFVAAGLFYILSFTNEELNGKAKNIMTYVVIGILIIFSAYTIVNTLLGFVQFG